jgi:ribosome biogenesis ATPase
VISRRLRLEGNFDFHFVAKRTPGFVGADLSALCKEAAANAVTRIFLELGLSATKAAEELARSTAEACKLDEDEDIEQRPQAPVQNMIR